MLFNSFEFLVFFPLVTILFFLLPHPFRWMLLLIASCVFYCFFIPAYLILLIFIILIDYFAAINMENDRSNKKKWLIASILANVGILFVFKYYNFFIQNCNTATGVHIPLLNVILPIGLSFHTFQAMSYTIEVYKGNWKAEKQLGIYALYVLFYPQLVAGPIERPSHIFPQLKKRQVFDSQNLLDGTRLMVWGFFKKLVIADNLSKYVDIVFAHPNEYHFLNVQMAIIFFSIQIYCDFSGYTDIARGAAKVMGYDLMLNFNRPFFSENIREFWHRWHISLSTWFRDYVYFPLGGSKVTKILNYRNILVVFLLSGFWHGAGWNFILWGLLHAIFLMISVQFFSSVKTGEKHQLKKVAAIIFTNIIVAYAFVFFRNNSIQHATEIIRASVTFFSHPEFSFGIASNYVVFAIGRYTMFSLLVFIFFLFYYEYKTDASLNNMNKYFFWDIVWFVSVIFCIIIFGVFSNQTFIYFQF